MSCTLSQFSLSPIASIASCRLLSAIRASPSAISANHLSDDSSIAILRKSSFGKMHRTEAKRQIPNYFGRNPRSLTDGFGLCASNKIASKLRNDRHRIVSTLSTLSFSSTMTRHRLSSAEFKLNDGFSVVAPINVIVPLSTCGKKMSLNRRWRIDLISINNTWLSTPNLL